MQHILYILYDGLTDPLAQSQVLPYLKGLTKEGYHFTIISCDKKDRFAKFRLKIEHEIEGYPIEWHPLTYHKSPPVLSTLADVRNITKKANELHIAKQFKAVHCRSYISALAGLWLKQQYGVKFIFDMRGFWADERVDGKIWKMTNPLFRFIYKYFKKKELAFLSNADYSISLTEAAKKIIHSWSEVENQPIPIQVIPCCVDTERFSPMKIDKKKQLEFKTSNGITDDDFILSYLGSIGTWYMLDEMLQFFTVLLEQKPHAKFLFLTNEPASIILESAKKNYVPADRLIIQKASFNDVPSLISVSHASIFFIMPVFSKKASSPTKHAELMSLGIPVICNTNVGDVDQVIEETGSGVLVENFEKGAYLTAIGQLENLMLIDPMLIRESANRIYGLESGIEKYKQVYYELLLEQVVTSS